MTSYTTRTWSLDHSAITRDEDSGAPTFDGHASVFGQPTLIGSRDFGFVEQIAPGAFDNVLDNDVRLLVNHTGLPLARTTNGTLTLSQDDHGLRNVAQIAATSQGNDVVTLLERGDVSQQSFGFTIAADGQEWSKYESKSDDDLDGMEMRTVTNVGQLFDTSIVTFPAYPGATGSMRTQTVSDDEVRDTLREVMDEESMLADAYADLARFDYLNKLKHANRGKFLLLPARS